MLSWIPLLGPILQGLFNTASAIYSKFKDTQLGMRQAEVQEAQISQQIIRDTNDDLGLRIMRDAYCLPAVVQVLGTGWDTMIAESTWVSHDWMWHVAAFPPSLSWYPLTVGCFLLGNIGMNIWFRNR